MERAHVGNLDRFYFRVDGVGAVSVADATDEQFHAYAQTLARLRVWQRRWPLEVRALFLAWCQDHGAVFHFVAPDREPEPATLREEREQWTSRKTG